MNEYIMGLNNKQEVNHELFEKLREYAKEYNVPIIKRESLNLICTLINTMNVKKVLEIGTAIAYSALSFASARNDVVIDTIERNPIMYEKAIENIKLFNKENQVRVLFEDALLLDDTCLDTYDLIFIDAAKAQYTKFFEKYSKRLSDRGIIVSDNILFHGIVESLDTPSKNVLNMVKKIDLYNHYLLELKDFTTTFFEMGDGLAITWRKKHEVNC